MTDAARKRFAYALKSRFGLTVHEYATIWMKQRGQCPICKNALKHTRAGAHVDHDHHYKGKERRKSVRGILCGWCNYRALGPIERAGRDRVLRAIKYLGWAK